MKYDIITPSDLHENNIKRTDSIKFTCVKCGCACEITSFRKCRIPRYETMLCENCYREKLSLENWGTRKPQQSEKCKAITEAHNLEKFGKPYINTFGSKEWCDNMESKWGVKYAQQSEVIRETTKKNNIKKWGVDHWAKSEDCKKRLPDIIEKAKKTCITKFGANSYSKTDEFIEKKKKTSMDRYGVPYYQQLDSEKERVSQLHRDHPEWGAKAAESNRNNHGGLHYFQTEEHRQKLLELIKMHPEWIQTSLENNRKNHGGILYTQTEERKAIFSELYKMHPEWTKKSIENRKNTRYIYYNESFDSLPEFCVYLYCIYHWIPIIRNHDVEYKYKDIRGVNHSTYPDFIINGQFVEIKGSQFFKDDGTMYLPYRNVNWTDEEYEYYSSIHESKRQCFIRNGVSILKDTDPWIQMCIQWVKKVIMNSWLFAKMNVNNLCYGYTPYNYNKNETYQEPIGIGKTPFDINREEEI